MAKKKPIDLNEKKINYGDKPEPVEYEPDEPEPMYMEIPDKKEVKDNEHT